MTLLIRRPTPEQLERVGELTVRAYQSDGFVPEGSDYDTRLREAWRRDADAELLVAVDGDEVLGTVTLAMAGTPYAEISRPGEAEFRMLAVDPGARRRGVARALVAACLDRARDRGVETMVLCSAADMAPAHRLYEAFGFHRLPDRDWSPVPGVQLLAFELPLRNALAS